MNDSPQPVPGDDKDWTWVLGDVCQECGFEAATFDHDDVAQALRDNASQWQQLLEAGDDTLRVRSVPEIWSVLEYACHVRDVNVLYLERLDLMLNKDGPRYPNWDQDATAVEKRYHEADPGAVALELVHAAAVLADRFEQVSGSLWDRTGYRSDGAAFTIDTFARYLIHDPIHHLWDVTH